MFYHRLITPVATNEHLDDRDREILADRKAKWEARTERARVGDFIILSDGKLDRFTHDWHHYDGGIQTGGMSGSFHLDRAGCGDYSGGLDPAIPHNTLAVTDEVRDGWFWFFSHDHATGHNGVRVTLPCRVYRLIADLPARDFVRVNTPRCVSCPGCADPQNCANLAALAGN